MKTGDRPLSYWITVARTGFEEDLARLMAKVSLSKADLAREADVSPPFITKVLNGTNNYTLKTMAKLARAIGAIVEIRLAKEDEEVVRVMDYETARELDDRHAARDKGRQGQVSELADFTAFKNRRSAEPDIRVTSDDKRTKSSLAFG